MPLTTLDDHVVRSRFSQSGWCRRHTRFCAATSCGSAVGLALHASLSRCLRAPLLLDGAVTLRSQFILSTWYAELLPCQGKICNIEVVTRFGWADQPENESTPRTQSNTVVASTLMSSECTSGGLCDQFVHPGMVPAVSPSKI